ncbi:MAG: cytochrome c oxidase assembly protein [Thermomicrobiales bacterium]
MQTILTAWDVEPSVVAGVVLLGAGYSAALWYGRRRGQAVRWGQVVAFLMSLAVLLFALISPLDVVGDTYLLSAHMIQHLLLILVVPPLALLGLPAWLLRAVLAMPAFDRLERLVAQPIVTLLVFTVGVAGWHLPVFYDAALRDTRVHVVEHLCFLGVATLFWRSVVAPLPERDRLSPLGRVLYLLLANLPSTVVAAPITFAPAPIYAPYVTHGDPLGINRLLQDSWGLTPLVDQQLAGVLMWVPTGLVLVTVALAIFLQWEQQPTEYTWGDEPAEVAR